MWRGEGERLGGEVGGGGKEKGAGPGPGKTPPPGLSQFGEGMTRRDREGGKEKTGLVLFFEFPAPGPGRADDRN